MTLRKKTDLRLYPYIVQFAADKYATPSDNDLEIDDQPDVSASGDNGFWVRARVYVRRHEAGELFAAAVLSRQTEARELRELGKRTRKAARVPLMKALLA